MIEPVRGAALEARDGFQDGFAGEGPPFGGSTSLKSMQEVDGEFTVFEGSLARASWIAAEHSYQLLRESLVVDGVIAPGAGGGLMRFTRNHVFASPSAAAGVIFGRTANGRNDWREKSSGMSYGEWQNRDVGLAVGEI